MNPHTDIKPTPDDLPSDDLPRRGHGHKPRERKDIASGELRDPADMLRLAFSPDGQVVADIYGKLPGRGAWIEASRQAVKNAAKSGAYARTFSRATKRKVIIADDFADRVEAGLAARVLGMIGMAKRAGLLESGFENVRSSARTGEIGVRIEASDGKSDGRSKIRVVVKALAKELETPPPLLIGCFSALELGKIIGRDNMVHACLPRGKMATAIIHEARRLAGFRELVPLDWPDREYETQFITEVSPDDNGDMGGEIGGEIGDGI
ncbi:MAG: DNA-binding protein [Robiginitomaculum sp.]|nr:MAG: DNA-binding protein [Robiginitomaculum sp.]